MGMNTEAKQIRKVFASLKPSAEWAFSDAGRSETNYVTHGYHRYPAKFIPNIVQKLIKEFTKKGDLIVDPFGGCGTTLVESKILGRKSLGFDINPVAKLITQTKITPINPIVLEAYLGKLLTMLRVTKPTLPKIHYARLDYWFDQRTQKELNQIYSSIKKIKDYEVRRFYLCAFSHILKNSSGWLMKSIKPTLDKKKHKVPTTEIFLRHLRFMMKRNEHFYALLKKGGNLKTSAHMRIADSTKRLPIKSGSVDLVVTSPPYVTSYEYADLHQLSLLWFGNDIVYFKKWHKHVQDFDGFRKKFVGTSLSKQHHKEPVNSEIAKHIIDELIDIDTGLAKSVVHYFADMNKSFVEMYRMAKRRGKICVIIGDTVMKGVRVANSEVAVEQMINLGFRPVRYIKREIVNKMITPWRDQFSGKFTSLKNPQRQRVYQYEYLLMMEKP